MNFCTVDFNLRDVTSPNLISSIALLSLIVFLSMIPGKLLALTVSPADIWEKDINYRASAALEAGERNYDIDVNFGGQDRSFEQSGSHNILMLRNDFTAADRVAVGLNLAFGDVDHGRLEVDGDELSLDGSFGYGGGLRVSGVFLEDVWNADWFADFQSFAIASDPPRTNLEREDWHLALGARRRMDWISISGGAMITGSQIHANGTSEGDTFVDVDGSQSQRYGLYINTKVPITDQVTGLGEVAVTDGITVSLGASYGFTFLEYQPPLARSELEGSRPVPQDQRNLSSREYLARAQESIANENFGKALDWLNQALDANPQAPEIYLQIARGYFFIGEFERSIKYMRHAVEQQPGNADFRYHLGRFLEEAGFRDEALNQYQRAIQLNPSHRKALYRLNELDGSI